MLTSIYCVLTSISCNEMNPIEKVFESLKGGLIKSINSKLHVLVYYFLSEKKEKGKTNQPPLFLGAHKYLVFQINSFPD